MKGLGSIPSTSSEMAKENGTRSREQRTYQKDHYTTNNVSIMETNWKIINVQQNII